MNYFFIMIQIIDKQIEFLKLELEDDQENTKVIELIRVLELFKAVFKVVLTGEKQEDSSALALFISQLITGKGDVDFVQIVSDFMKMHKITQKQIQNETGTQQGRISDFINRKHSMQSDTLSKIFSVASK